MNDELIPLPVHVVSVAAEASLAAPAASPPRAKSYTVVLTSDEPVKQLLPPAPNRGWAIIQAIDHDVVLCDSQGQAQAKQNITDTTLATPQGSVIPVGVVIPIRQANELWAAAATYPSRISVIAAYH